MDAALARRAHGNVDDQRPDQDTGTEPNSLTWLWL